MSPPKALISSTIYCGTVDEPWLTRKPQMPSCRIHSLVAMAISLRILVSLPLLAPCMVPLLMARASHFVFLKNSTALSGLV